MDDQSLTHDDAAQKKKDNKQNGGDISKVSTPTYNPAALLNPKAAAKRAREGSEAKEKYGNGSPAHGLTASDEDSNVGQRSLIENMYGVRNREAQPVKKRRVDSDEDSQKKSSKGPVGPIRNDTEIGKYLKEKRDQGAREAGPPQAIDLTADDDDDVILTHSTGPDPNEEVCMGMLQAKINADRVPAASSFALGTVRTAWPSSKISMTQHPGEPRVLNMVDRNGNRFGKLDLRTADALAPLITGKHTTKLRWQAILVSRKRKPNEQPGDQISDLLDVQIYLYVPRKLVAGIGKNLSQKQVFLSNPLNPEPRKEVVNPHVPKMTFIPKTTVYNRLPQDSSSYSQRTVEEIRNDVQTMFDSLAKVEDLPEMEPNMAIIKTPLMSHQKQALHFMTRQETALVLDETSPDGSNPLWKSQITKTKTKVWYNVITGHEVKTLNPALGGLFADMMGLGKTLSILSRVVETIEEAREFGDTVLPRELEGTTAVRNTRATLIVCPKSVLSNWDEQIKAHLKSKKISYFVYHGSNRTQDLDELDQYDVIITSYNIVGVEHTNANSQYKALGKLNWYRIVLDEAHTIRNQGTAYFKSACALHSKRRWAVTGTPIQNKLDDLGALIKFLKVPPFGEQGAFEKYIFAPFKTADPQALDNLRLLVDAITLRRSKEKIDLPPRDEQIVRLDFSDAEQALYEAFAKDSRAKLNAITGRRGLGGKGYAHVLAAITRLRLICAHGRELLSNEDLRTLEGQTFATAIDLGAEDEDKPALSEQQVYDMFYLLRESGMNTCSRCPKIICGENETEAYPDPEQESDDDDLVGYLTPCYQILCPACIKAFKAEVAGRATKDAFATCPICDQYIRIAFFPLRRTLIDADQARREALHLNPSGAKNGGNYDGPHTKVKALISCLLAHSAESAAIPTEPPVRSVVFSGWTQYLDLIEIALRDAEIGFVRLDGKMSVSARSAVMERFRTDASIAVILVSIRAGGQGLNFTAASNVYMMEPQFNPGVEMQAIDRVHRLGQRRAVAIRRFVMAGSFEEKIVELQRKKMELAAAAMARGKLTKAEEAKKKLEDLRSLFR